ncbi:DUF2459 domain-containing protein [Winogradskyella undariae]|uniref:DUF2459 domain-containing protein n=1 Tax=Winogradskyella undariae TaxID=1285465 RepID=UPI00156BA718|nr:DUF2459 domain-containing protein [Winogradskyella undariae]NRR93470.1 DUF2459 domain-containing protein [Winogradskyella undariae]
MRIFKKALKWFIYFLIIPTAYSMVALILTAITVDRKVSDEKFNKVVYLTTNGVHLDIVIPKKNMDTLLLNGIHQNENEKYLSFGWGDENFYINTPTWGDLTFKNAITAMFLKSSTLIHVTRYQNKRTDWIEIKVTESELQKLNSYLINTFETNENRMKIRLENKGYTSTDDFYKSKGSYSCFKTCNSWVNIGFKESGLKSCLWTPFDFGLMNKYQ